MPLKHTIWIQHRHQIKHISVQQNPCAGIITQNKSHEPIHHKGRGCLSRMYPGRNNCNFLLSHKLKRPSFLTSIREKSSNISFPLIKHPLNGGNCYQITPLSLKRINHILHIHINLTSRHSLHFPNKLLSVIIAPRIRKSKFSSATSKTVSKIQLELTSNISIDIPRNLPANPLPSLPFLLYHRPHPLPKQFPL